MSIRIATINIEVRDVALAKKFYMRAFGMTENERRSHPPSFAFLESGSVALTLTTPVESTRPEPSKTIEIGFETDDLAAAETNLVAAGAQGVQQKSMGWGDAIELHDLDGYRIVVYSFKRQR